MIHNTGVPSNEPPRTWRFSRSKAIVIAVVFGIFGVGIWVMQYWITLDKLAEKELSLRAWGLSHPWFSVLLGILVYVLITGLSLPGATLTTLVFGWFFGFWRGLVVVSLGSTAGATVAFLLSRFLFRTWIRERFGERFRNVTENFERDGPYYLFTLRLIPIVPFFVINMVMGLTSIRARTFWWVSQLGMLPATVAYVYAGASIPSLNTLVDEGIVSVMNWQLFLALVVIGLLPIAIKRIIKVFG